MTKRALVTAAKATGLMFAAVALTFTTTGTASANSFTKPVYQGKVWYNDGKDRFCAKADEAPRDRAIIYVTLTPYNSSRGPKVSFHDIDYAGATCRSLATAYEDTKYRAKIKSLVHFDRGGDSTYKHYSVDFWS